MYIKIVLFVRVSLSLVLKYMCVSLSFSLSSLSSSFSERF